MKSSPGHIHLRDHLGNLRVSLTFDKEGKALILQEHHYYPFGLRHKGYGLPPAQIRYDADRDKIFTVQNVAGRYKYWYNGKEWQEDLDYDVYSYGWREYDPALGRFMVMDRFAEKYASLTPYQYAGNNPVFFVDMKGDSLTESAQVWANKLKAYSQRQITRLQSKIDKKTARFKAGKMSRERYEKKIAKLNGKINEYSQVISEIETLESSSQWYDLKYMNESYSSGSEFSLTSTKRVGELQFDKNSNMVVLYMSPHDGLNIAAHEFKHAYQFETGDMSFDPISGRGNTILYDQIDEREADKRAGLFGVETTTYKPQLPKNKRKLIDIHQVNALMQSNYKFIIRFNGKNYIKE